MVSALEFKPIRNASRRIRYQSSESLDLEYLLKLLELEAVQNESILHDNWHPKILTNVIKSVYMRPPYNLKDFDVFFLTNPNGKESVKRRSIYLDGYGHFIQRYDEEEAIGICTKLMLKTKIALVFLKSQANFS